MAKYVSKKTTTTVTEVIEMIPVTPGEEKEHRFLKVYAYGAYKDENGQESEKPQIILNGKWLAEAGFNVGDQVDVVVKENELVIKKMILADME